MLHAAPAARHPWAIGFLSTLAALAVLIVGGCRLGEQRAASPLLTPAVTSTEPNADQSTRIAEADSATAAGDYDVALALFRELLAENPTLVPAHLGMGRIHGERGEFGESERDYRRASQLEPRNYDAQFGHGHSLRMLRRFREAIDAFFRALTIRPDSFEANINLAMTYVETDQPSGAMIFAEKAVELKPDDGAARISLGTIYHDLGRYADAVLQYEAALELTQPTPDLLANLLGSLAAAGRHREALNTADYLLEIRPTANVWERKGWAHFRLRDYEASISAYRESVGLDPDHWVAWRGVGVNALNTWLLSRKSDGLAAAEARDAFRRSLRINTEQPKVVQLLTTYGL